MACSRCLHDPYPESYDSPRKCAFDAEGWFTDDNWYCATLSAIAKGSDDRFERTFYGFDESIQVIPVPFDDDLSITDGFIVLTQYKSRGRVSSGAWMGNFWPIRPLTLELCERVLAARGE